MSAVPKLRFPEFDGDFKLSSIGEFSTFSKGKGISKADISEDGTLPCIRYGELYTHYGVGINTIISKTDVPARELYLSEGGEVIVPASGETPEDISTASVVMHAGVALGGDLNIIKTSADGYFLASYISGKARNRLASMAQGNSVVHLYGKQVASLEISLPSLPEQQKIASFLSSVDKKIDLLRQKKTEFVIYKKGFMQKIFSQEIRFSADDGSDFPDWQEVALGDVLIEHKEKSSGTETVFSVSVSRGLINQVEHLGRSFSAADTSHYNKVKPGDVVYTKSPTGSFPLGIIKQSNIDADVIVSPLYGVFTPETEHLGKILDIYFESEVNVGNYLTPLVQKGAKNTIACTNRRFLEGRIVLPRLADEQEKIASFLSVIDSKIKKTTSQIEQTETFKKGLLQQMFV